MTRAIAIRFQPHAALAVAVQARGNALVVEGAIRLPFAEEDDAKLRGQQLAAAIAPLRHGRAPTIAVVSRADLYWQTYELPPMPADDLPESVHLQVQRDLPVPDNGEGFDFIPLSGDELHPYRVLGVGVAPTLLARIRDMGAAAEVRWDRLVAEPLGWLELGRRISAAFDDPEALTIFAAIAGRQASVWASSGGTLKLARTIWLADEPQPQDDAAALGGELRRTFLALSQAHDGSRPPARCIYCGANADEIAGLLSATISRPVQAAALDGLIDASAVGASGVSLTELAPLAALAAAAAERRPAPLDLLHPRRRPAPPSRLRSYVLAGVAAVALVALVVWQGYRNLQAPLEAADLANEQRKTQAPLLESLAAEETKAAAIRAWVDDATNMLIAIDHLGEHLRPEPFDSEKFDAENDVVLTKFAVAKRQLTLSAAAKSTGALSPVESRLRAASYRVDRGPVESDDKAVPGYSVKVAEVVERVDPEAPTPGAQP